MSNKLYQSWRELLRSEENFALITVIRANGSTPRGAGTKMLVNYEGIAIGTIGGGCPEAEAWDEAKFIAKNGGQNILEVNLANSGDIIKDGGEAMICGGHLQVFIEHMGTNSPQTPQLLKALDLLLDKNKVIVSLTCVDSELEEKIGERYLFVKEGNELWALSESVKDELYSLARETANSGQAQIFEAEGERFFAETFAPSRRMYIAGAGHVSRPLSLLAHMCGFQVTVNDDRPEYATHKYLPEGVQISSLPFSQFFASIRDSLGKDCAVILVTRGHKHDEECLRSLIDVELGYLGMIGSKRRTILVEKRLLDEGVDPTWVEKIHAPIGLDTGGDTPEEIAVSIMAEVNSVFYNTIAQKVSLSRRRVTDDQANC